MSYATPTRFRGFGLPAGALEGVSDGAIQAHLGPAGRKVARRLRGRNIALPVAGDAIEDLADCECTIAAYTFLVLYRGVTFDDPSVQGYRELAKEALAEVDDIATGITNLDAAKVSAGGGGLAQSIGPATLPLSGGDCDPWGTDRPW